MLPGGPDPFGDGSDEPDAAGGADPTAGHAGGPFGAAGGWIPPDDRPWRHPSELGAAGEGRDHGRPPGAGVVGAPFPRRSRRHRVASLSILTAAALAVAVGSLLLLSTGEGPGTPQSSSPAALAGPVTAAASCCTFTAAALRRTEESIVALAHTTAPSTLVGCGVVVAGAGLVVTTANAVGGRRVLRAVTASGRQLKATVMAVDHGSDVALLSVPAALPAARFANDGNVGPRFPTATVVIRTDGRQSTAARTWRAAVTSVGTPVPRGAGAGMAAIMVDGRSVPSVAGEPLLDAEGKVIGILDRAGTVGTTRPFLPAPLVVGVAKELATTGKVQHGWLGLEARDARSRASTGTTTDPVTTSTVATGQTPAGAQVVDVEPGSAAAGALVPGDVIIALDGQRVRTMAELRDRLYVLPPGSRCTVTAMRSGRSVTEVVELSPSP